MKRKPNGEPARFDFPDEEYPDDGRGEPRLREYEMQNSLSGQEVHRLVDGYPVEATEITIELFKIGELLVRENEDRASRLDSKATSIVGYAGVILAFLMANASTWSKDLGRPARTMAVVAAVLALVAIVTAFVSMRAKQWRWFSDREWFEESAMKSAEVLRRYYITVMHEINQENGRVNERKARGVVCAQYCLAAAALILALMLRIVRISCEFDIMTRYQTCDLRRPGTASHWSHRRVAYD